MQIHLSSSLSRTVAKVALNYWNTQYKKKSLPFITHMHQHQLLINQSNNCPLLHHLHRHLPLHLHLLMLLRQQRKNTFTQRPLIEPFPSRLFRFHSPILAENHLQVSLLAGNPPIHKSLWIECHVHPKVPLGFTVVDRLDNRSNLVIDAQNLPGL